MLDFAVEIIDLKRGIYFEHSSVGALHMGEFGAMKALDYKVFFIIFLTNYGQRNPSILKGF